MHHAHTHVPSRAEIGELLRRHDITPTYQRSAIALALFSRQQHLSADQILALVNEQHAEVSKATVYNTLRLFVDKALIREVIVDPTRVFYDPNTTPHHHFYHVESGELTDIDGAHIEVSGLPKLPEGTVAAGVDIVVRLRSDNPASTR
jgi:Fur family transcriptional regulator, iron response regulator